MRIQQQPGFVLHQHPYSETSLLLEVFTAEHGRVGLLAKGARRPASRLRGALNPFQPLILSWSGRGELPILTAAEPQEAVPELFGEALFCGFYVNELLVRLLHRHDSHSGLFHAYRNCLTRLAQTPAKEATLRVFEKRLLAELGYGLVLDHDIGDNSHIVAEGIYDFIVDRGPLRINPERHVPLQGVRMRGASLLALANETLNEALALREIKTLMRAALSRHLGDKPLRSRELFRRAELPLSRFAVDDTNDTRPVAMTHAMGDNGD